ncbi:MCE family protein [Williamsia sterculiae]|uniref:Phospholipid/cholesterol/gamma-HCH transport system substrate-binding protein n=1 Tax=Williamsia sterculiae TaxID=1344003 RepID=A0A1N7D3U4_9NOCA|nr:MCE family protein [Williamsia sterculiae]SIR70556.1 phospholipid/cholesterol/gamma-HCH transport system substrate-binding protein [Williamsia sterculiae]
MSKATIWPLRAQQLAAGLDRIGPRRIVLAAVSVVTAAGITGCGGISSVPLPGGADTGDHPRTYNIQFADVLDLVPQSAVKFNGVVVGSVKKISIAPDQWTANVKVEVKDDVNLSDQSRAEVQQTNLLGEKFISLEESKNSQGAARQDPAQPIPLARTRTATDVEQVLGALSMLLNGGGLAQLKPIVDQLNTAFGGREDRVKSLLNQTATLINGLNVQKDNIVSAIDGLAQLSNRAVAQKSQIEAILRDLPAGIGVLEDQRPQLVSLLQQLDKLGQVGVDVLGRARNEIVTDLKALRPTLQALADSAPDLITALPLLPTYPFPDSLLPGVHGDSTNLYATLDLRLLNQLDDLGVGQGDPVYRAPDSGPQPKIDPKNPYYNGNGPRLGYPTITLLPLLNARPGPNTPPSGGQYSVLPTPAQNQPFLAGAAAMLTNGKGAA